jgi:putative oxidoreductase
MTDHAELNERLRLPLLLLRLSVFLVMAIWVLDKFVSPEHAIGVFEHFYLIKGLSAAAVYAVGTLQGVVVLGFLIGFQKRVTYGLVFLMHLASTVSSYRVYLDPWAIPNILFWAAWPMLAAAFALYYLRDQDTLLTLPRSIDMTTPTRPPKA